MRLLAVIGISMIAVVVAGGCGRQSNTQTVLATHTPTPSEAPTEAPTETLISSPTQTPEPGIGSTQLSPKDGMVQVYVPEGEFEMGSIDGFGNEKPVHTVYLDAFWIDQTEVTNAMYELCVKTGGCREPQLTHSEGRSSYYGDSQYDAYPVIYVDWAQAKSYCEWAGRRLPTEAEWEKAARGVDGRTYPWGENISCDLANYYSGNDPCVGDTTRAGNYSNGASPYGALDMAGNVWEWISTLLRTTRMMQMMVAKILIPIILAYCGAARGPTAVTSPALPIELQSFRQPRPPTLGSAAPPAQRPEGPFSFSLCLANLHR